MNVTITVLCNLEVNVQRESYNGTVTIRPCDRKGRSKSLAFLFLNPFSSSLAEIAFYENTIGHGKLFGEAVGANEPDSDDKMRTVPVTGFDFGRDDPVKVAVLDAAVQSIAEAISCSFKDLHDYGKAYPGSNRPILSYSYTWKGDFSKAPHIGREFLEKFCSKGAVAVS